MGDTRLVNKQDIIFRETENISKYRKYEEMVKIYFYKFCENKSIVKK